MKQEPWSAYLPIEIGLTTFRRDQNVIVSIIMIRLTVWGYITADT